MWYASSAAPSGTVSPRWIMRRMACTSDVRNSCALGLNSSFAHLQQRGKFQQTFLSSSYSVSWDSG